MKIRIDVVNGYITTTSLLIETMMKDLCSEENAAFLDELAVRIDFLRENLSQPPSITDV